MNNLSKIILLAFAAIAFSSTSCRKAKCDQNIPAISYLSFQQYRNPATGKLADSAKVKISFKDCDGDIGLADKDTLAPYDTSSKYYYNFVLQYFEMKDGSWINRSPNPGFRYRVPVLVPEGKSKILEGEIACSIIPRYFNNMSPDSDTIKFSIQIYDRALNESNIVETPMVLTKN